ncbi:protein kinase [Achlya hypogyna]|uniref:Protein kinase n=1 Tax=Achlya hypogyna TaxID=1202772 RepID=A0A1V9YNB3_ACHHY|nr:protein kinase [Achlya hypogyna]
MDSGCPYEAMAVDPGALILVADEHCPRKAPVCLVRKDCSLAACDSDVLRRQLTTDPAVSSPRLSGPRITISAIGNLCNYSESSLYLDCNGASLDVTQLLFPTKLHPPGKIGDMTIIKMDHCNLKWPQLKDEWFNDIIRIKWPSNLDALSLQGANLQQVPGALPTELKVLNLANNRICNTPTGDLKSLKHLDLSDNVNLARISDVHLSNSLTYFGCRNTSLADFRMDVLTYAALTRLTSSTLPSAFQTSGAYINGRVGADPACTASDNSLVLPLWPSNSNITWAACVTESPFKGVRESTPSTKSVKGLNRFAGSVTNALFNTWTLVAAVVAMLGTIIVIIYRRRRAQRKAVMGSTADGLMDDLRVLEPVRIPMSDVSLQVKVNEGAFGEIWRGEYEGRIVAIKRLLPERSSVSDIRSFIAELALMTRFDCPQIVALYGVAWTRPKEIHAVIEYMGLGDLRGFLATRPQVHWGWKLRVLKDVVDALVYLHSMNIIHRDLKSRNVLLDATKGAKVTDFGVSKEDFQETMTISVGTYRWMAPEILKDDHYTVAADIFSLGMILSELDSHEIPYAHALNPKTGKAYVDTAIVSMVIAGTITPSFTPSCPAWLRATAQRCLAYNPHDRPTAIELAHSLSSVFVGQYEWHNNRGKRNELYVHYDTWAIIGTGVFTVLFVALIGWCVVKRVHDVTKAMNVEHVYQQHAPNTNTATRSAKNSILDLTGLYKIRLESSALHLETIVGHGSFAEVWKGTYNGTIVAVKRLQNVRQSNQDIQDFINEIQLTAGFDSPYIIKIIGVTWTSPSDLRCVIEFMDLGDLKDYLATHNANVFLWPQKLQMLQAITSGLSYLHSLNIVHRDLKSRNVLLDSKKGVKLVDFGVAKEDIQGTMTLGVGTFRWMAPEVLHESAYTVAADIYSFGMLLSEMDTHHIPYEDLKNPKTGLPLADPAIISSVMNGTMKPTFTATCPGWLKLLADACLQFDPSHRPTIYDVVSILSKVKVS